MAFQYIVVPYDGSLHAERALEHAVRLAEGLHATLDIVYVDPTQSEILEQPLAIPTHELNAYFAEEEEDVRERLTALTQSAHPSRVTVLQGHAGKEIVRYAAHVNADLIIIGSRGLGAIQEWMLGSVSHYVAQHAQCAVTIVK
ncbi:universal stress protein [Paenibacillus sp. WLX1005]|uniref:universal stress protein n=1 Tax=Paenibacillus sp. WLX1005 TaxID=3243766 RepID=UPI0039841048